MPRLFSSSRSPRVTSNVPSSIGVATIGGTQICLTMLEKIIDGIPAPFVKGSAGAMVEVIKIARTIHENKQECNDIITRCTSLLVVILSSLKGKAEAEIPNGMRLRIESLTADLHEILAELRVIGWRSGDHSVAGIIRAILCHIDNTHKLKGCLEKLDWAVQEFQVTCHIDSCLQDLERHEELLEENDDIIQGQTALLSAVTGLSEDLRRMTPQVTSANHFLSTVILPETTIFGRDEYIKKAINIIGSFQSIRLAVLGAGGIGKTSVALKIIHHPVVVERFKEHRHWVPCEQATSLKLLVELLARSLAITISTSNDRLKDVTKYLESSRQPHIFLFDNFETTWDVEGEQSHIADILTRLAAISTVSILLTMRGDVHPMSDRIEWSCPRLPLLGPLTLDAARAAFLRISPNAVRDTALNTLIEELDCVPLAITLMARLSEENESPSELLPQWRTERTRLLDQAGGDHRNSIEVSIQLSLQSPSVRADSNTLLLLRILAGLPAGASRHRLPDICSSLPDWRGSLRILRRVALTYEDPNKETIHVLSPIRSYMLLHYPLDNVHLNDLRQHYYSLAARANVNKKQNEFLEALPELRKEEVNLETVLLDALQDKSSEKEAAIKASLDLSHYLFWTYLRSDVIISAERVARNIGSPQHADCLWLLSEYLRMQSRYGSASRVLKEAKAAYEERGSQFGIANCLWGLGNIHRMQERYSSACSILDEARDTFQAIGYRPGVANCLWSVGNILWWQDRYEPARSFITEARAIYAEEENRHGATNCLWSLGNILGIEGSLDMAHRDLEEAMTAYESLGDRIGVANCQCSIGNIFQKQGRYAEACDALTKAKETYTALDYRFGIADSLRGLGAVFLMQDKPSDAHSVLQEAQQIYTTLSYNHGVAKCLRSIGEVLSSERKFDEACSVLEEAMVTFTSGGNHLDAAKCLAMTGSISRKQGDYTSAHLALEKARRICSEIGDRVFAAWCTEELDRIPPVWETRSRK